MRGNQSGKGRAGQRGKQGVANKSNSKLGIREMEKPGQIFSKVSSRKQREQHDAPAKTAQQCGNKMVAAAFSAGSHFRGDAQPGSGRQSQRGLRRRQVSQCSRDSLHGSKLCRALSTLVNMVFHSCLLSPVQDLSSRKGQ